jgi:hypothetical protein
VKIERENGDRGKSKEKDMTNGGGTDFQRKRGTS